MNGQHSKLILQLSKALSMLSQKTYTNVLSGVTQNEKPSLFNLLQQCRNELSKADDKELTKIVNLVQKEVK